MKSWRIRKLGRTLKMVYCMFMAQTFGEYVVSHDGPNQPNCAEYRWHGKRWWIPTGAVL